MSSEIGHELECTLSVRRPLQCKVTSQKGGFSSYESVSVPYFVDEQY